MQQIADLNAQLAGSGDYQLPPMRRCADQRDSYIDQLSQLMDIRVVTDNRNQINVFTNSGIQLVGADGLAAGVQCPGHGQRRRRCGTPIPPKAISAR